MGINKIFNENQKPKSILEFWRLMYNLNYKTPDEHDYTFFGTWVTNKEFKSIYINYNIYNLMSYHNPPVWEEEEE